MSTTPGKSTYDQIFNDAGDDINEDGLLVSYTNEAAVSNILRAQALICNLINVQEQYDLGINNLVEDYPFQDRPRITAITGNGVSPIVITAVAHGLATGNRILIQGVQGNTAANINAIVTYVTADTFSIQEVGDVKDASNDSVEISVMVKKHGWVTGDSITISGVTGNTAANGTFSITVVDVDTFTIPIAGNGTYISGGIAVKATTGDGAYTHGGRFWRDDELPTYIKSISHLERPWSNFIRPVIAVDDREIIDQVQFDSDYYRVYTAYSAPMKSTIITQTGSRIYRLYPAPKEDMTVVVHGTLGINPRLYTSDQIKDTIFLGSQYDEAIRLYLMSKMYWWMKKAPESAAHYQMFQAAVEMIGAMLPSRVRQSMKRGF